MGVGRGGLSGLLVWHFVWFFFGPATVFPGCLHVIVNK